MLQKLTYKVLLQNKAAPLTSVFVVETMIYQPCYVTGLREISVTLQRGFFKKVDL